MFSGKINNASDLMSIALQVEREAIRNYSQLAMCMRQGHNASAAALFERLVVEEQAHERLLIKWMDHEGIGITREAVETPSHISPVSWSDPQVSDIYNDEACDPHHSTPYRALAFAVHNEETAFHFYTQVAANSENDAVRRYAEILAREELGHAALLRAERRVAYHKERKASMHEPVFDFMAIHNEVDLLAAAVYIDRYLVDQMNALAKTSPQINMLISELQQQIIKNEKALSDQSKNDKVLPGEGVIRAFEQFKLYNIHMKQKSDNSDLALQRLYACCDRSFVFYDSVVETATDEAVMLAAQKLTSLALDHIGVLKQTFENSGI